MLLKKKYKRQNLVEIFIHEAYSFRRHIKFAPQTKHHSLGN